MARRNAPLSEAHLSAPTRRLVPYPWTRGCTSAAMQEHHPASPRGRNPGALPPCRENCRGSNTESDAVMRSLSSLSVASVSLTALPKLIGGSRTRIEDPAFGTFGEGQQKYGENKGGGWGDGAGRGDENDPVPA